MNGVGILLTVLIQHYIIYIIFSKIPNRFKNFNEVDRVAVIYNVIAHAKEAKFEFD